MITQGLQAFLLVLIVVALPYLLARCVGQGICLGCERPCEPWDAYCRTCELDVETEER